MADLGGHVVTWLILAGIAYAAARAVAKPVIMWGWERSSFGHAIILALALAALLADILTTLASVLK